MRAFGCEKKAITKDDDDISPRVNKKLVVVLLLTSERILQFVSREENHWRELQLNNIHTEDGIESVCQLTVSSRRFLFYNSRRLRHHHRCCCESL